MKAKKILAGACASLMLAAATVSTVSAADAVKGSISKTEAKAGGNFSVTLDLADIPAAGINGCDFGIKYDSSVITVTDVKLGDLAKDESALEGVNALETNIEAGLVSIIYGLGSTDSANYMKGSGTFLVIDGTVSDTAKAGDKSSLKVVAVDRLAEPGSASTNGDIIFGNLAADNLTSTVYDATITDGLVTVVDDVKPTSEKPTGATNPIETNPPYTGDKKALLYGDVDLDGKVALTDVTKLAKFLISRTKYPVGNGDEASISVAMEQSDVTHNGKIESDDNLKIVEVNLKTINESDLQIKE